jgi:7-cyano-7-deazaguanine synthase
MITPQFVPGTKVVVAVSGGMDSATLLAHLIDKGCEPIPISFIYGSKHNQYESAAADKLCVHYGLQRTLIDLTDAFIGFKSALMGDGPAIPEGHYTDASMSATVVPARNIIFSSFMAGLAWSKGAPYIALGVHAGDHAIYEDCRPEFIKAMDTALFLGTGSRVEILAPFLGMDKGDIAIMGTLLNVPYELTRTCYKDQPTSCGKCGSCVERIEAFAKAGRRDPLPHISHNTLTAEHTILVGGPDDPNLPGGRRVVCGDHTKE